MSNHYQSEYTEEGATPVKSELYLRVPRKVAISPNMASVISKLHEEGYELAGTYPAFGKDPEPHRTIDEALDVVGCFMYAVDHMTPDKAQEFISFVQRVALERDERNAHRYDDFVPQMDGFIDMLQARLNSKEGR